MTSTSWEFFDTPTSGHNKLHMKLLSTNLALSTHIPCIFRPSHLWSASVYQCSSPLRSLGSYFWWTHEPKLKRNDALRKWWFFSFTKYVCMNFAIQAVTWILNPFKNASHCLKALIFRPISQHALYRMYDTPQWTFKTWAADRISFRLFGFTVLCWNFRLRDLHHIFIGVYLRGLSDNITHKWLKRHQVHTVFAWTKYGIQNPGHSSIEAIVDLQSNAFPWNIALQTISLSERSVHS